MLPYKDSYMPNITLSNVASRGYSSSHNGLGGVLHVTAKLKPSNMLQQRLFSSTSLRGHYALHRVSYKYNQL